MKRGGIVAGQIVHGMRSFVRRGGRSPSVVELNALVLEVCELCRPQIEQAHVRLSVNPAPGEIPVEAELLEIQQVLVNLVQNAAQAVATCERDERRVAIGTRVESGVAVVEVADSGPGFPTELAEKSFAPFFSTKPDGLGMGLSISRTLLERYHGQLWGKNRAGGGAVVGFQLPLVIRNEFPASTSTDCVCR